SRRSDHQAVHIDVEAALVQLLERLSAIRALEGAPDFDPNVHGVGVLRMERDRLHMGLVITAREGPRCDAGDAAQRGEMPPMVAQVCADVQLCRLGARVQAQLIAGLHVVQRKDLLLSDPVASAFPSVAAVLARPYTTATHSREDRAPGRLDDQRLDVLPAQLTAAFLPG